MAEEQPHHPCNANVHEQIAKRKRQPGKDLLVFCSRTLCNDLLAHDLVDEDWQHHLSRRYTTIQWPADRFAPAHRHARMGEFSQPPRMV